MFYRMITKKRDQWLTSSACTVKDLLAYMEHTGQMRDAQIEAIATYLFLKIACGCKPLAALFSQGTFNTLDLDKAALPTDTRLFLRANPAAAALYEYACLGGEATASVEETIRTAPEKIDYAAFFRAAFYNVSYTDYLFSLPMGAGKTYLMAAFIYLELYFARNEPDNPAFAHNFMIFAPSGLKSSVVPSLKTIQNFEPSWVLPEPSASAIRRMISFEVLDQAKTASKSNKTKNPNVQKIASHQPLNKLFGLVAVTNAEKVIYNCIDMEDMQLSLFSKEDQAKIKQSKELREIIGEISKLSVFIDEVHHASAGGDSKLRKVVEQWTRSGAIHSVVGFSGTPYLEKAEKVPVTKGLSISAAEISNIVYYYPLIEGVGNFLKRPVVKIEDRSDSARIIENGVRLFLDTYKDTVYPDGTTAKLGIYCGTIEKLEEMVFPLVSDIVREYGLPAETILRFHRGNKAHPQPSDSQMEFEILDKPISRIRIVLLVQIGKEGWDCRSLTGIILSQEGDCPRNMVLQTSCRCLRQVDKGRPETALIYLNETNAKKLEAQLQQQHHISLQEFTEKERNKTLLHCYDRTEHLKLPPIDFCQLKVIYDTLTAEKADPKRDISLAPAAGERSRAVTKTTDFTLEVSRREVDETERGTEYAGFNAWLYGIAASSFGTIEMSDKGAEKQPSILRSLEKLNAYREDLYQVFLQITYERDGQRYFSSHYDRKAVEAAIRKAYSDKRDFTTRSERIPEEASLLKIENFTDQKSTSHPEQYYPDQGMVERIHRADHGPDAKTKAMMQAAEEADDTETLEYLRRRLKPHPQMDRSFHYLPYHTDSDFEQTFLETVLTLPEVEKLGLEVYYNGDRALTEFKIKCYKKAGRAWHYVGLYTPDFLILQRRDGKIYKAIIAETKGKLYANDPAFQDRRTFMETEFLRLNNAAFGYERFEYLYLESRIPEDERIQVTHQKICAFFKEEMTHAH